MRFGVVCLAALTTAVLALGGCAGEKDDGDGYGKAGTAKGLSGEKRSTATALNFTATTLKDERFAGASLKGKPSVLWFWAPWCGTCKQQASGTAAVAEDYSGKVNVLGVAGLDKKDAMRNFVSSNGVGKITHLADERHQVWKRFGVTQQSVYVLLDNKGDEVERGTFNGESDLRGRVDGLLN